MVVAAVVALSGCGGAADGAKAALFGLAILGCFDHGTCKERPREPPPPVVLEPTVRVAVRPLPRFEPPTERPPTLSRLPRPPKTDPEYVPLDGPSPRHVWVSGYWDWRERWVWRPGRWRIPPPGMEWQPPSYTRQRDGIAYVAGYWAAVPPSSDATDAVAHRPSSDFPF